MKRPTLIPLILALAATAAVGAHAVTQSAASVPGKQSNTATAASATRLPAPLGAGHQQLAAGVHVLDLVAREQSGNGPAQLARIAITLPAGWFNYNGWALNTRGPLSRLLLSFWDVALVYPTPCHWLGKPMVDPGSTVDGLASALASQPLRHATTPHDVVLAGFRGQYLQLWVPRTIDFAACDQGYFESWTGNGWSSDRYEQAPGQVDRLWILNVDGQRLVVDASYLPNATAQDRAALQRVVDSIDFLH